MHQLRPCELAHDPLCHWSCAPSKPSPKMVKAVLGLYSIKSVLGRVGSPVCYSIALIIVYYSVMMVSQHVVDTKGCANT